MTDSNVSRIKRITTGIIGLMMLVIVLFAAFYIAAEAGHDCAGEDCPICVCLHQCEVTLRSIGEGISGSPSVIIPTLFTLFSVTVIFIAVPSNTLISQKIRLNN